MEARTSPMYPSALCTLNDPSILESLLQHLPTSQGIQRWQIITLLEHFRDPRAVEPLLALLNVHATEPFEKRFQIRVIKVPGTLGDGK